MPEAAWAVLSATLSAGLAAWATLWRSRRQGPDAQSQVVDAAVKTMLSMRGRIDSLERRIVRLESKNDAYYRHFGPLPPTQGEPS